MAEYRSRKGLHLLAFVLSILLIGGVVVIIASRGSTSQAALDEPLAVSGAVESIGGEGEPDSNGPEGPASGAAAAAGGGPQASGVSATTDEQLSETSEAGVTSETGRVEAIVDVGFSCPEGTQGSAGADGSDCVSDAGTSTDALVDTIYRCPSGSTGDPTDADPTCERTESTPAIAGAPTYSCPSGSSGNPTGSDPTCLTGGTKVDAQLTGTSTECPPGSAYGASDGGVEGCIVRTTEVEQVPAETNDEYSCPGASTGTPSASSPWCTLTETGTQVDPAQEHVVNICTDGELQESGGVASCIITRETYRDVNAIGHSEYRCPPGSRPSPNGAENLCVTPDGSGGVTLIPADLVPVYTCPAGAQGNPTPNDPVCVELLVETYERPATESIEYSCPAGSVPAPNSGGSKCLSPGSRTTTVAAKVTKTYRCPTGATGSPTAASPTCTDTVVTNELVDSVEVEHYGCPAGSSGRPSAQDPYCRENAEPIEAIVTTAYTCPAGYTAPGPLGAGESCSRTVSVPADVDEVVYRCPDGATGSPSAADPTCTWSGSESVAAVETVTYTCPPGSVGQPSAADPFCTDPRS